MTKAPDTIFVKWPNENSAGLAFSVQNKFHPTRQEYVSRSHCDALVAAAYEDASDEVGLEWANPDMPLEGCGEHLRQIVLKRTPADAKAAYDAAIAQARVDLLESATWEDTPDDMTVAINADHPMRSGRYDTYCKALELVSNRHSKSSLVDLVNHLLIETETRNPSALTVEDAGWQPIETAPQDGTTFDTWCVARGSRGVRITDVRMRGDRTGFGFIVHMRDGVTWNYLDARNRNEAIFPPWTPTHWRPLPDTPKEGE